MSDGEFAALHSVMRITNAVAEIVGHVSVAMAQSDAFNDKQRERVAELLREIATQYEAAGNDKAAAEYWSTSRLVERGPGD